RGSPANADRAAKSVPAWGVSGLGCPEGYVNMPDAAPALPIQQKERPARGGPSGRTCSLDQLRADSSASAAASLTAPAASAAASRVAAAASSAAASALAAASSVAAAASA